MFAKHSHEADGPEGGEKFVSDGKLDFVWIGLEVLKLVNCGKSKPQFHIHKGNTHTNSTNK